MRAALRLEQFRTDGRFAGYLGRNKTKPWVARILGTCDHFGLEREFIRGYNDYAAASGTGGRGIYTLYALDTGVYEVNERVSWKGVRRYFIQVENAEIAEITREQGLCLINAI